MTTKIERTEQELKALQDKKAGFEAELLSLARTVTEKEAELAEATLAGRATEKGEAALIGIESRRRVLALTITKAGEAIAAKAAELNEARGEEARQRYGEKAIEAAALQARLHAAWREIYALQPALNAVCSEMGAIQSRWQFQPMPEQKYDLFAANGNEIYLRLKQMHELNPALPVVEENKPRPSSPPIDLPMDHSGTPWLGKYPWGEL